MMSANHPPEDSLPTRILEPEAPRERTVDRPSHPEAEQKGPEQDRSTDKDDVTRFIETQSNQPPAAEESSPLTGGYTATFDGEARAHRSKEVIPGYEVLSVLGRGGMGIVYKARQKGLDRVVALKMILAGPQASDMAIARFRAEAQAVARFQHANIIQIYEIGDFQEMPYFSLEYVTGGTLSSRIARQAQTPQYSAEIVAKLARAMQYSHDRGIVHRDLKPANILLTGDGEPKVADFGLAKSLGDDSGHTQSGQVLGSPSYMAPEQARGDADRAGPPADIYALGAILYDLLTGRPPFSGSSVMDTLEMVRTREPVAPNALAAKIPRDIETICLKCLQKDPAKRYSTAGELADDLTRFLEGRPIKARPISRPEKAWRWAKRNPVGTLALGLALLLMVVPSLLAWQLFIIKNQAESERDQKETARKEAVEARYEEEKAKNNAIEAEKVTARERDEKEQARASEQIAKERAIAAQVTTSEQRRLALDTIRGVLLTVDKLMQNNIKLSGLRLAIVNAMLIDLDKVRDHALKNPLED